MKILVTLGLLIALAGNLAAATTYAPKDYLRAVQDEGGGAGGVDTDAPKEKLASQLAATEALLPLAPDETCRDAANAQIAILFAALGNREEATLATGRICNQVNREKRRLHIIALFDGNAAAIAALRALIADPAIPESDHVLYVEKVAYSLRGADRFSRDMAALCVEQLGKTRFKESTAQLGQKLVKYCEGALKAKAVDPQALSDALRKVLDTSPRNPKMAVLLEPSEKLAKTLPPPREDTATGRK